MARAFLAIVLGLTVSLIAYDAIAGAPSPIVTGPADAERQVLVLLHLPPPHFHASASYGDAYDDSLGRSARRRVAARLARAHGLILVTDWPMPLLGVGCYVMSAPAGHSAAEAVASLAHEPAVAWTEPMGVFRGQAAQRPVPNDPLYPAQPAATQWRLSDLHEMSLGRHVLVAVVDSQVQADHPDLAGQIQMSRSFVPGPPSAGESHGTGVAGVIAAREGNGLGIAGVAPGAQLMILRACWQTGISAAALCDSLTLAEALHFAIENRAQVINLSLAGPDDLLLGRLIDVARARGITVVSAYDKELPAGGFPASHTGVVAVSDEPVEAGPEGPYMAPGRDVPTTQPGGTWSLVSGSSFAAAHVSGLVALARERAGGRAPVLAQAHDGRGAIDACATLVRMQGPCDCACARPASATWTARR
jgi:subtilisin family serine protease